MDRRTFLSRAVGAACACPACASLIGSAAAADWTYEGNGGPAGWGKLAPEYAACMGKEQSPIDLTKAIAAMTGKPKVDWKPVPLEIVNNGYTIQVNGTGGGGMELDGTAYDLVHFHFHHPGEHTIDGAPSDMEIHFLHRAATGGLAMLAVLVRKGAADPTLETIFRLMPRTGDSTTRVEVMLQAAALLPKDSASYRYAGSLTEPPCSEVVSWVVFRQPITASAEQIDRFAKLFPNNARPVQPLGRRKLLLDIL
jgi:carbonic anhydrase